MPKTQSHPSARQVDMSAEAIDRRLRDLAQLYKLGMSLRDVTLVGKATDARREDGGDGPRTAQATRRIVS